MECCTDVQLDASFEVPRRKGLRLELRLGMLTALIVTGAMAILSGAQLYLDLRAEMRDQQERLRESLAPLAAELQTAPTLEAAAAEVAQFHSAYRDRGMLYHQLSVVDASGRTIISSRATADPHAKDAPTAAVSIVAPTLGPETYSLTVTADGSKYLADRVRRWRGWATHVAGTAFLILALLYVVVRREITGPIGRLLDGVRKMELGYWDDMPDPGGAWEIRWLAWRFRALAKELSGTVEHLVAAQRRAYMMDHKSYDSSDTAGGDAKPKHFLNHPNPDAAVLRLHTRLDHLRGASPDDLECRRLAQIVWNSDAIQAEKLGESELRMDLEDAALRVLDPVAFHDVSSRIEMERPKLEALARARGERILRALAARNVPTVQMRHRIKHPAGIWKKMVAKKLAFEQVHDLVALRIVVPTEADCYYALGAVHDLYVPIVGRFKDYITRPKSNGYRSLHSSVRDAQHAVFEVQIRSVAMHRHAETGAAAHANYKDATRTNPPGNSPPSRIATLLRRWCAR